MKENLIYGRNPVLEAMDNDVEVLYIQKGKQDGSIKKIIGRAKDLGIPIKVRDRGRLNSMAEGANHQGVIAYKSSYTYSTVEEILDYAKSKGEDPLVILLDELEDPQNLGAIARSAQALGAHGLILTKHRSAHVTGAVYKSSAGAIEHIKVAIVTNLAQTMEQLKEAGLWVYGADAEGESLYKTDLSGPIALVIGAEGKGLRKNTKDKSDVLVSIPMSGGFESLNAASAASILIYEVQRQKNAKT